MSYSDFSVENYRGLGRVHLEGPGQINLISGRNDAGKSSLLEALYLHACGPFAGGNALGVIGPMRGQQVELNLSAANKAAPWNSIFFAFDTTKPITFDGTFRGRQSTVVLADANGTVGPSPLPDGSGTRIQTLQGSGAALSITYEGGGGPKTRHMLRLQLPTATGLVAPAFQLLDPPANPTDVIPAYMITGRGGAELAQTYSVLRQRNDQFDVVTALQGIDDRIMGLEVLVLNNQPALHAEISDVGLVPLNLLGGGPLALATYLLGVVQAVGGILLIDEIENGLHWSVLRHMWGAVSDAADHFGVQVFATTHSRECMLAATEALAEAEHSLVLYRLHRNGPEDVKVGVYDQAKLDIGLEMNLDLR